MSGLLLMDASDDPHGAVQQRYTPYFYGAESVLTDGDPRLGIPDDHVPFMTRGDRVIQFPMLYCINEQVIDRK